MVADWLLVVDLEKCESVCDLRLCVEEMDW